MEFGYKWQTSNGYLTGFFAFILLIQTASVIMGFAYAALGDGPLFSTNPISAFLVLLVEYQYDEYIGYFMRTLPKFLCLMALLACMVCTYTALGLQIFDPNSEEAKEFFPNFGTGVWNMLMVLCGSNWPTPMIPAIEDNRLYSLYFYIFIIAMDWGLLNLVLGFVYLFFRVEQIDITAKAERMRAKHLHDAFNVLDRAGERGGTIASVKESKVGVGGRESGGFITPDNKEIPRDSEGRGCLSYAQMDALLTELYRCYVETMHPPNKEERLELTALLDRDDKGFIDEVDFALVGERCSYHALKSLRNKKAKFVRYVDAAGALRQSFSSAVGRSTSISAPRGNTQTNWGISLWQWSERGSVAATEKRDRDSVVIDPEAERSQLDAEDRAETERIHRTLSQASAYGKIDNQFIFDRLRAQELDRHSALRPGARYQGLLFYIIALFRTAALYIDTIVYDIWADSAICLVSIVCFSLASVDQAYRATLVYLSLSLADMALKMSAKGLYRYIRSNRNSVDGLVTLTILIILIIALGQLGEGEDARTRFTDNVGVRTAMLVRTLMYPRNLIVTAAFKQMRERNRLAFNYAFRSAGHFAFLLLLTFVCLYSFAALGLQLFGGSIIKTGSTGQRISVSLYGQGGYWPLNFNDMPSALVTMFVLLHVNNTHVTTSGFVASVSQWAEVFFACWYALGVLLLLNVLTAVFVNQFAGYLELLARKRREDREKREREDRAREKEEERQRQFFALTEQDRDAIVDANSEGTGALQKDPVPTPSTALVPSQTPSRPSGPRASYYGSVAATPSGSAPIPIPVQYTGTVGNRLGVSATPSSFDESIFASASKRSKLTQLVSANLPRSAKERESLAVSYSQSPYSTPSHTYGGIGSIVAAGRVGAGTKEKDKRRGSAGRVDPALTEPLTSGVEGVGVGGRSSGSSSDNIGMAPLPSPSTSAPSRPPLPVPSPTQRDSLTTVNPLLLTTEHIYRHDTTPIAISDGSPETSRALRKTLAFKPKLHSLHGRDSTPVTCVEKPPRKGLLGRRGSTTNRHDDLDVVDTLNVDAEEDQIVISMAMRTSGSGSVDDEGSVRSSSSSYQGGDRDSLGAAARALSEAVVEGDRHSQSVPPPYQAEGEDMESSDGETQSSKQAKSRSITMHEEHIRKAMENHHLEAPPTWGVAAGATIRQSLMDWMYNEDHISPHEKAAVLVQFARDGEEHNISCSERSLTCYRLRAQYSWLFRAVSCVYALLRFFERPLWTFDHDDWHSTDIYPVSKLPLLPVNAMCAIKLPLLCVLLIGFVSEIGYKESFTWKSLIDGSLSYSRCGRVVLTLLCFSYIMVLFTAAGMSFSVPSMVTVTSAGSIMFLMWFNRRSLQKSKVILRILPRLFLLLAIFFVVILIFAGFGPMIFDLENATDDDGYGTSTDDADVEYFSTFADSVWSVFVAITSSDYPNQIMPAYRKYREVCIYFITFISVGAFGFLNLIVVIVLVEFQKATQFSQDLQRVSRQILLMRAFEVLDPECKGFIERHQVKLLLQELYEHYADFQKAGIPMGAARSILIDILDIDGDGKISLDDFLFFLDVMRIKLSLDTKTLFIDAFLTKCTHWVSRVRGGTEGERETRRRSRRARSAQGGGGLGDREATSPWIKTSIVINAIKYVVTHRLLDISVDGLSAALIVTNLIVNHNDLYFPTSSSVAITVFLTLLYTFELCLKLLVRGPHVYPKSFRNRVDGTMAITLLVCLIGQLCITPNGDLHEHTSFVYVIRIVLMARLILLPRNIRLIFEGRQEITKFTRLLRRIFSKIATLAIVFLCVGYIFASLGVFAYGGLVRHDSSDSGFLHSAYVSNGFWALNFNDFASACMTLFACLHVSDFDVIATGFTTTTSNWSRLYFTLWYVVGVLLMLNVVKSFFLGEFLALFVNPKRIDVLSSLKPGGEERENGRTRSASSAKAEGEKNRHGLSAQQLTDRHMRRRFIDRLNQGLAMHEDDDDEREREKKQRRDTGKRETLSGAAGEKDDRERYSHVNATVTNDLSLREGIDASGRESAMMSIFQRDTYVLDPTAMRPTTVTSPLPVPAPPSSPPSSPLVKSSSLASTSFRVRSQRHPDDSDSDVEEDDVGNPGDDQDAATDDQDSETEGIAPQRFVASTAKVKVRIVCYCLCLFELLSLSLSLSLRISIHLAKKHCVVEFNNCQCNKRRRSCR